MTLFPYTTLFRSEKEQELQKKHNAYLTMLEIFWHQRSRVNWAQFGDRNTTFFHTTAVIRHRQNLIRAIQKEDGDWESSEKGIRQLFLSHFREIYAGSVCKPINQVMPAPILAQLPQIPAFAHESLSAQPSEAEVMRSLASLGPDKAPGPDGINARLLQQQWEVFRPAIMGQVNNFFQNDLLPSSIARSNLVLVPKCENPAKVTDFRPISVCNVIYKLISKILATRIKPYIAACISENQCADRKSTRLNSSHAQ